MGIDFETLPNHLSLAVSQKTELKDFVRLSKASKVAKNITSSVKTRMTWEVPQLLVNHERFTLPRERSLGDDNGYFKLCLVVDEMHFQNYVLEDTQCEEVIEKIKSLCATVRQLHCKYVDCSADNFNMLLKTTQCSELHTSAGLKSSYLLVDAFSQIKSIKGKFEMDDDTFFKLTIPSVELENDEVTCYALNLFLKEWLTGTRQFKLMVIETWERLNAEFILDEIPFTTVFNNATERNDYHIGARNEVLVMEFQRTKIRLYVTN